MEPFFVDVLPEIKNRGRKFNEITLLTKNRWVSIDNILYNKTVYVFRQNKELLISRNGMVEKANWKYLENQSISINKKDDSFLLEKGFYDKDILIFKIRGNEDHVVFVNENRYNGYLNSIGKVEMFLTQKYLGNKMNYHYQKIIQTRRVKTFEERRRKVIINREKTELKYNFIWSELYLLCFAILLLIFASYYIKYFI
jgi:hypothetical protein